MEGLQKVLVKTVSSSQRNQDEAVTYIQELCRRDFVNFIKTLSDILYDQQNPPVVRAAAGLQLKNQLTARDEGLRVDQQERWRRLPEPTRLHIKDRVLKTLRTGPSSTAQCVACIAQIELPANQWPELFPALAENATSPRSSQQLKLASLEAIGFICKSLDRAHVQASDSGHILYAILSNMQDGVIEKVRLAATTTLLKALRFGIINSEKRLERDLIMRAVCNASQSSDADICVVALRCLVKIMSLYYQHMDSYMRVLCAITTAAMKSENDDIALRGFEFWSKVCDREITLAREAAYEQESGEQPERISKQYAQRALPSLLPVLVRILARQDARDATEEWEPSKSAGVCLMLLAECCKDAIVEHAWPHLLKSVSSKDWRRRDAAIMTIGSILEGLDESAIQPVADQMVPFLVDSMQDSSGIVRYSATWEIGELYDRVPEAVLQLPHDVLDPLVDALSDKLESEPRIISRVSWSINSLITAAGQAMSDSLQ